MGSPEGQVAASCRPPRSASGPLLEQAGGDFIIVGGDAAVLSIFAAAACAVDLREHGRFELRPGAFYDLRELVQSWREGRFVAMEPETPSEEDVARGRAALRDLGPRVFSETEAGSWVLGEGVRR